MTAGPGLIAVVVPCRNEQMLLPRCLTALAGAADHLQQHEPAVALTVTVVLDMCTDSSADIVAASPLAGSLTCSAANVGTARDLGVHAALQETHLPPSAVWAATTDADSVVPRHWLTEQLEIARAGWDVMVGTVEPSVADLRAQTMRDWSRLHRLTEEHQHIHGANLGFLGSAYRQLGGFPHLRVHEDRAFVLAARSAGLAVLATDRTRVLTSGRNSSKVRGGFADYVAQLEVLHRDA